MKILSLRTQFILASCVLVLCAWISSGTLSPYALTAGEQGRTLEPCHYLINQDHPVFWATFLFMDGKPASNWIGCMVLRRILYPALAYPFMKAFGFMNGGFIANIILHLAVLGALIPFISKRFSSQAAVVVLWILVTYPGIYYWIGLPYSYAIIVPSSLLGMMLLWQIPEVKTVGALCWICLSLGVLFLAYDLWPYFGVAALILVFYSHHRFGIFILSSFLLMLPIVTFGLLLKFGFHAVLVNPNSAIYGNALKAFCRRPDWARWLPILRHWPGVLRENFLSANFVFLPYLFLAAVGWSVIKGRGGLHPVEMALSLAILAIWVVNNACDLYDAPGIRLGGTFAPRIYQPFIAVIIFFLARFWTLLSSGRERRAWTALAMVTVFFQLLVVSGGLFESSFSERMYYRFYKDALNTHLYTENLQKYGRRPLGFCVQEHYSDELSAPSNER